MTLRGHDPARGDAWLVLCPAHDIAAATGPAPSLGEIAGALAARGGPCDARCAAAAFVGRRGRAPTVAPPVSTRLRRVVVAVSRPGEAAEAIEQTGRLLAHPGAEALLVGLADAEGRAAVERELGACAELLARAGVPTYVRLDRGPLAARTLDHAALFRADLVVLVPAAAWTPGGWALDPEALRLVHACPWPLLLLGRAAPGGRRAPRVLVPLDGSARAADVLAPVEAYAAAHEAEVVLLRVARVSALEAAGVPAILASSALALEASLADAVQRLSAAGLRVTSRVAIDASESAAILRVAAEVGADVLALATRGEPGLDAWPTGSVADAVIRRSPVPLLLQRVDAATAAPDAWSDAEELPTGAVLVPTDGSALGDAATNLLARLVPAVAARAALLRVLEPGLGTDDAAELEAERAHLRALGARLERAGVPTTTHVVRGRAAERILAAARAGRVGMVVMASHGRAGLSRWARGSVTEAVLRRSSAPVLTVTPASLDALDARGPRFARVLVADDGSSRALAALHPALAIARAHRGEVTLFGVAAERDVEALTATLTDHARAGEEAGVVVRVEVVVGPSPAVELLRAAAGADLVAIATHGREGLARAWLGSVTETVLHGIDRPLLVARGSSAPGGAGR